MTAPDPRAERLDAELIAAWRRGSQQAAAQLVRRHTDAVGRYLAACGARDDLEDVLQETFFRAFRKLDSFRGDATFRTWVMTIGSNTLKDLRRRRRKHTILDFEERDVIDTQSDPHGQLVARDAEKRLVAALERLPRLQRDVFLLRAQQGLPYEEIAGALNTTTGAARVHYHHAVKRLKSVLE